MGTEYKFHAVDLGCRESIETLRHRFCHTLSAHAFASLYLWQEAFGLTVCVHENAFFVRCLEKGEQAYFFPCGDERAILEFVERLLSQPGASLCYIRQQDKAFLEQHFPGRFFFTETPEDSEYIYRRETQITLPGGAFRNLRAKIHKARDRRQWQISELTKETLCVAETVARRWSETRQETADLAVIQKALEQYDILGFQGILLEDENGPQAVAFGSMITEDTFDLHVTKTLLPSVDSYLKWELYRRLSDSVLWINQEEDLGIPGLRTNKKESCPEMIVPLWKGVLR